MNKEHNTIEDIEYLLTALENGVDADDYWREISDLRATLKKVTLFVHQPEQPEPVYWENEKKALLNEIDHLTNRLAQPEQTEQEPKIEFRELRLNVDSYSQEPAAWMWEEREYKGYTGQYRTYGISREKPALDGIIENIQPLYTSLPKRDPLTEKEISQTTKGMSEFGADMFKAGIAAAESSRYWSR